MRLERPTSPRSPNASQTEQRATLADEAREADFATVTKREHVGFWPHAVWLSIPQRATPSSTRQILPRASSAAPSASFWPYAALHVPYTTFDTSDILYARTAPPLLSCTPASTAVMASLNMPVSRFSKHVHVTQTGRCDQVPRYYKFIARCVGGNFQVKCPPARPPIAFFFVCSATAEAYPSTSKRPI